MPRDLQKSEIRGISYSKPEDVSCILTSKAVTESPTQDSSISRVICLPKSRAHLVNLMAVQAAKIHETLTEAAAVDHGHTFTRPKDVHDDSLHGAGA